MKCFSLVLGVLATLAAAQTTSPYTDTKSGITFNTLQHTNGTYVNSTHWTYTFLCSKCIQTDGTTFKPTDAAPSLGFAFNPTAPVQKTNPASSVSKHTAQGQAVFDLSRAKSANFEVWKAYAVPKVATGFAG
ncbi:uncharacterized protein J4E92_010508 [Alternaria infectoria]|uniref:uncharacterized protein n=1 Tax=Alternaria infectoria TaxID=45303 RepID=UPI00221FAC3D|nr:uncharacterized protein J4E92_010508 [Alternaria infectoria]KAI4909892.1 hypothetical protein J4E92_010508 [Alternaria infectoria]